MGECASHSKFAVLVSLVLLLQQVLTRCDRASVSIDRLGLYKDSVLLQSRAKEQVSEVARALRQGESPRQLPLCDPLIVDQTCRKLGGSTSSSRKSEEGGDSIASSATTDVSWALLAELLSTPSLAAMRAALELPEDQPVVGCMKLCAAAVQYVRTSGGVLPPSSNVACRTVRGNTTCDVEVDPEELAQKLGSVVDDALPDAGPMSAPADDAVDGAGSGEVRLWQLAADTASRGSLNALLLQTASTDPDADSDGQNAQRAGRNVTTLKGLLHYSTWEAVERIANLFCVYPSLGQDLLVSWPEAEEVKADTASSNAQPMLLQDGVASGGAVEQTIATRETQAKAWLATILRELAGQNSADLRRRWFGGAGYQSEEQVRQRVLRTMNFVQRELSDRIRFVYPADSAQSSPCSGGAIAYVWRASARPTTGYEETRNPRCRSTDNPFTKNCGLDEYGRYYVYLCRVWERASEDYQIGVFVHEAAHHAGPNDVTNNREQMKRNSQTNQLMNAANYQHFAQEVVQTAQGCMDLDGACQYYKNNGYCGTSQNVQERCQRTCGLCGSQPAPPTCTDTYGSCQYYKDNGLCTGANVRAQCRKTCGLC